MVTFFVTIIDFIEEEIRKKNGPGFPGPDWLHGAFIGEGIEPVIAHDDVVQRAENKAAFFNTGFRQSLSTRLFNSSSVKKFL
jgi:hypothetical protein